VASPTLQPSSAPPIATSKPSLSPPAREPTPNLPPWIVLAALFILVAGGIMVLTYRHRRG
jgi:hypothetical protein